MDSGNRDGVVRALAAGEQEFLDLGNSIQVLHADSERLPEGLLDSPEQLKRRPATLTQICTFARRFTDAIA